LKFAPFEVNVKSAVKKLSSIPLILVKEVNGFICITPTGSVNYVVLSGDVAKDLGFISRKASLPVLVHPGYSYQDGIVTLRSPLLKDQFVTASYYCEETLCPRCKGSSVENDVSLDDLGDFEIVKDHDLLAQLVIKAVLTEIGSNVYHSWYGTSVSSLIGKTFNDDALSRVRTEVQDSIRRVQSQQTLQAKYQQVTLKERFGVLNSITLDRLDYRTLKLEIAHTSASGEPIVITQTFSTVGARNKLVTR
jgi:phage baseplate assembly protein W